MEIVIKSMEPKALEFVKHGDFWRAVHLLKAAKARKKKKSLYGWCLGGIYLS